MIKSAKRDDTGALAGSPRISVVIVCVRQHQQFLDETIASIESTSFSIDEKIVVASGWNLLGFQTIQQLRWLWCKGWRVFFRRRHSAGSNRNFAWERASGDLVSFHDADDFYCADRLQYVVSSFNEMQWDVLLHSYENWDGKDDPRAILDNPAKRRPARLVSPTMAETTLRDRDRDAELGGRVPTNLVFAPGQAVFDITHGHVTVKRTMGVRFHEKTGVYNEDGVFVRDCLEAGLSVALSREVLSLYRAGSSAKIKTKRIAAAAKYLLKRSKKVFLFEARQASKRLARSPKQ